MATGYERLMTAALSLFYTFGVCTATTAFVARCYIRVSTLADGIDISMSCTANRPVASVRCFDNGLEIIPCNFPIQLPTGPGSSVTVVMVVFRDYEGNTAISSGSVDISDTGGLHINSRSLDPATSLVQFNPSNYTVNEHETVVTLSAERVGNTSLSLLVDFATRNGTALGGRDFVAVSGSLNFLPLETRKNISIAIRDDGIIEEMEYFYVQLFVSGGLQTNVILGAANLSVVNIMDSGGSEPSLSRNECPAGPDPMWDILWTNTPAGESDVQKCSRFQDEVGTASRYCDENGNWGEPNVLECESTEFRGIRLEAERIFESNATLEEVLAQASALTARVNASTALATETMQSLLPRDLNTTNNILSNTITLLENSIATGFNTTTAETQEVIIDIFNNVLSVNNHEGWQSLQTVGAGSQLLLSNVERFGLYVASSEDNTSTTISRPNIVMSVMQYGQESTIPVTFPTPGDLVNISIPNLPATITIPSELFQERLQEGEAVPVVNVLFQNLERFLPATTSGISNNSRAVSVVLSSQVALQSSSFLALRENPITLSFTFEQEAVNQDSFRCVFWNFSEPIGNGGWISDGVRTVGSSGHSQGRTTVQCESTHLTSFAVLVDVHGEHSQLEALRVVSYIGCVISLSCLAVAVVFYLFQRKKLFTKNSIRFVHLNLTTTLFLAYLTFVVGIELARGHKVACIVVAALLHYLFLASFCWMLCEGVMIFLMLVVVFSTLSRRWWFFLLLG